MMDVPIILQEGVQIRVYGTVTMGPSPGGSVLKTPLLPLQGAQVP